LHSYYIHFKKAEGVSPRPRTFPPVDLPGWNYQVNDCGVLQGIIITGKIFSSVAMPRFWELPVSDVAVVKFLVRKINFGRKHPWGDLPLDYIL